LGSLRPCRVTSRLHNWLVGALLLLTTACGTEPAAFRVGCSSIQSVEVGSGLAPRIDWEPGCSVAALDVFEAHPRPPSEDPVPPLPTEHPDFVAGSLMWGIASPDSLGNRLEASLRYGEAPVNALEQKPADPLQEGQPYLVRLTVRDPEGFTGLIAWGLFTP
jgi:hypothetical protein